MQKSTKVLVIYALCATLVAVISIWQVLVLLDASNTVYVKNTPPVACPTLAEQLEKRAYEIREENKDYDLERYRHEAILEVNRDLQKELGESPFVDMPEVVIK